MMHEDVNLDESADGLHMAIVVSRYHQTITSAMRRAAVETFIEAGGLPENLLVLEAPGTFELPVLCGHLARRRDDELDPLHGIIALGCVITGETTHDQHINTAVSTTLAQLSADTGMPIAFGVLTCATVEQAEARAGGSKGNKGAEAMRAAIAAANAVARLRAAKEPL